MARVYTTSATSTAIFAAGLNRFRDSASPAFNRRSCSLPGSGGGGGGGLPAHDAARFAQRMYTLKCWATHAPACADRTSATAVSSAASSAMCSATAAASSASPVSSAIAAAAASSASSIAVASASDAAMIALARVCKVASAAVAPAVTSSNSTALSLVCATTARPAATSSSTSVSSLSPEMAFSQKSRDPSSAANRSADARCASPRCCAPLSSSTAATAASRASRSIRPACLTANRPEPSRDEASPGGGVAFPDALSASSWAAMNDRGVTLRSMPVCSEASEGSSSSETPEPSPAMAIAAIRSRSPAPRVPLPLPFMCWIDLVSVECTSEGLLVNAAMSVGVSRVPRP